MREGRPDQAFLLQEWLKALIGFIDVAGLYFALWTQLRRDRNISQNHKLFQAVGLGE
ncbi:hypothetical protein ACE6H2_021351 [Prunus campanulata]